MEPAVGFEPTTYRSQISCFSSRLALLQQNGHKIVSQTSGILQQVFSPASGVVSLDLGQLETSHF